jgi:hypothetical protein
VNEDLLNVFEKEFDVMDMTQYTLENLFKHLNLKPDPKALNNGGGPGSHQQSPSNAKIKSKINTGINSGQATGSNYNTASNNLIGAITTQ